MSGNSFPPGSPDPPTEELIWFSWVPEPPPADPSPAGDLKSLGDAIRRHESRTNHPAVPRRPADHALYHRLEEIERSLDESESESGGGNHFQIRGH